MQVSRIPFTDIPQFSQRDVAYATGKEDLRPFYKYPVTLEAFGRVMEDKANDATDRELLASELENQYAELAGAGAALEQIGHLRSRQTFTVITAHQPSLFTGPLYFILKICSAINLARNLNDHYPDNHVVPVFIVGGEDHDFAEINHTSIDGQRIEWDNGGRGGSVGALPTNTLSAVLNELKKLVGSSDRAKSIYATFEKAYTENETYGAATVALVHALFGDFGLVVADMSRPKFKATFRPIMERELFESVSQPLIERAQQQLTEAGYKGQAHARDINLFYLTPGRRDRIVREGDTYGALNTDLRWNETELRQLLQDHPERFSPNVVMRPLFQELIFPNLAYIGGGGELAYWLERKKQFVAFGLNFPMLVRRNSALWVDHKSEKYLQKLALSPAKLLAPADIVIRGYVEENSTNAMDMSDELQRLGAIFNGIAEKAKKIDPTLVKAAYAEHTRQAKAVAQFETRLRRTEKQKFAVAMRRIRFLKKKLFPGNNGLQERSENFLTIYLEEGPEMFDLLVRELDPLVEGLVVIRP